MSSILAIRDALVQVLQDEGFEVLTIREYNAVQSIDEVLRAVVSVTGGPSPEDRALPDGAQVLDCRFQILVSSRREQDPEAHVWEASEQLLTKLKFNALRSERAEPKGLRLIEATNVTQEVGTYALRIRVSLRVRLGGQDPSGPVYGAAALIQYRDSMDRVFQESEDPENPVDRNTGS